MSFILMHMSVIAFKKSFISTLKFSLKTTQVQQFIGRGQCILNLDRLNVLPCSHSTEKGEYL